ncbi:MAG: ABC transporter substrate-binding protein [Proteobacteria bacterium]|nr:ABC transporter substrate-binding protein [Pseudomonadota bacterium]
MKKTMTVLILFILSGIILFGCGRPQPPKAPDEVKLQLKWLHQAQFAGFYMAQEKGYYAKENIKITFLEGGQDVDIAGSVVSRKADFGVVTPEYILINRSRGLPLIAIAAIYRRSAVAFAARANSGIVRPADFKGKTVAAAGKGGSMEFDLQLRAMMKKLKIDILKLNIIPYDPEYASFYSGKTDVTAAYYTGGIIKIRKKGMKINLIWPEDYGINFYSDTLATTEKMISDNPDLVERFMRASMQGWQDAIEDYRQAVVVSLKYVHDKEDSDTQTAMMEAMLPLVHTGEDRIGWMKPEIWHEMYGTLLDQGLLEKPFDVDQAYTMRFIKEISGGKVK